MKLPQGVERIVSTAFSHEARFLLACLQPTVDLRSASMIGELLTEPLDGTELLHIAARHRVRPLLYARLRSNDSQRLPTNVMAELSVFNQGNTRRTLQLIGELFKLLDALTAQSIAVVPFKGPVLATSIYGSSALREAGDLDLLVHRCDIEQARQILISMGHRPIYPTSSVAEMRYLSSLTGVRETKYLLWHSEHHLLREQGNLNVDLHWALAVQDFHLAMSESRLWSWITSQEFGGRTIESFSMEMLLIVLCINGAKDCWERLDRICDIAALLWANPQLNWTTIFEQSKSTGVQRIVRLGLLLAADLLHAPLPEEAAQFARRDGVAQLLADTVQHRLFLPESSAPETATLRRSLFHIRLRERIRDRVGYCVAHMKPNVGDWAAVPLPPMLGFLHAFTRPVRLAWRHLF